MPVLFTFIPHYEPVPLVECNRFLIELRLVSLKKSKELD